MNRIQHLFSLLMPAALALGVGACSSTGDKPPEPSKLESLPTSGFKARTVWRESTGGFEAEPSGFRVAVDAGVAYTASEEGVVSAYAADSGKRLWRQQLEKPLASGPGLAGQLVLVGSHDGEVLALDQRDGSLRWTTQLSGEVLAPPRGDSTVVIVRCFDGRVYGLDAGSGQRLWVQPTSVPTLSLRGTGGPLLVAGRALVGLDNGKVLALQATDGTPAWESVVSVPLGRSELERLVDVDAEPLEVDGSVYAVSYSGDLVALDFGRGRNSWRAEVASITGMAALEDTLYVSARDGSVVALDRSSGSILWRQKALLYRELSRPVIHQGQVVVADLEGYVHWISPRDGRLVARLRPVGDRVSAPPVVSNGRLFVLADSGRLAAVELQTP